MKISNANNNYTQWFNNLPIAKNSADTNSGTVNHQDATKSVSSNNNASTNIDKILYSGEKVQSSIKNNSGTPITECELYPSSERDYSVNDAFEYQYNKQFTIKLDDIINGNYDSIKLRDPREPIPQEFIERLKQNGIQENSYDFFRTDFYINGLDYNGKIEHSVDYLASGYVVANQHISDCFAGDERKEQLTKLQTTFQTAIETFANKTAKELGEIFKENGVSGETQKIYDSVIKAYNDSADKYSSYIKSNKNYAQLERTENSWLQKDDSYMACELRKNVNAEQAKEVKTDSTQYYSMDELTKTQDIVNEIKNCSTEFSSGRQINSYCSEEEIGLKLAEISLKGEVFSKYEGVSNGLKNIVRKTIINLISNITDKLNEKLRKDKVGMAEPEKMADLDKKSIFEVYDKVMSTYKNTGDVIKALKEGAAFGKEQHMEKTQNIEYSNLLRYGNNGSLFWNNFYQNTVKYKDNPLKLTMANDNCYIDKESGIQSLSKSWNSFVLKFSNDSNLLISETSFSVYA